MYLLRQGTTKWLTLATDMSNLRQKVAAKQGAQVIIRNSEQTLKVDWCND